MTDRNDPINYDTRAQDALNEVDDRLRMSQTLSVQDVTRIATVLQHVPASAVVLRIGRTNGEMDSPSGKSVAYQLAVVGDALGAKMRENEELRNELWKIRADIAAVRRVFGTEVTS